MAKTKGVMLETQMGNGDGEETTSSEQLWGEGIGGQVGFTMG